MSARVVLLRDALAEMLAGLKAGSVPLAAVDLAESALHATAFAVPAVFPASVPLRGGGRATLLAVWNGAIWGAAHDEEGSHPYSWNLDGSYFALSDPDEHDIVVDEGPSDPSFAGAAPQLVTQVAD